MHNIKLDGTHNTRDISQLKTKDGYHIKKKKILRSGCLYKITSKDILRLQRYDLAIVIDFRSQKEFINKADIRIKGVKYFNFPALPKKEKESNNKQSDSNLLELVNEQSGGKNMLLRTYEMLFITKEGLEAYTNFFKILQSNHHGSILFHCSQGKDRAGMAAFLLEYALGVSLEDCIKDYLFTNKAMELKISELTPVVLKQSNNDHSLLPVLKDVFTAQMDYLNKALETINTHYGSIDNFLVNTLKVDLKKLRKLYLEK